MIPKKYQAPSPNPFLFRSTYPQEAGFYCGPGTGQTVLWTFHMISWWIGPPNWKSDSPLSAVLVEAVPRKRADSPLPILTQPEGATPGSPSRLGQSWGLILAIHQVPQEACLALPELPQCGTHQEMGAGPLGLTCQREAKHVSCHINGGCPLHHTGPGAMARAVLSCCHAVIGDDVLPAPGFRWCLISQEELSPSTSPLRWQ